MKAPKAEKGAGGPFRAPAGRTRGEALGRLILAWVCVLAFGTLFAGGAFAAPEAGLNAASASTPSGSLQKGIELYRSGKADEALSALRGFVVNHYDSPDLSKAYLYLARIFRDRGKDGDALLYLDRIPADQRGPEVLLLQGASLVGTGETRAGMEILQSLDGSDLSGPDRGTLYTSLAEGKLRQGLPLQALLFLQQGASAAGSGAGQPFLEKAHQILSSGLDGADLAQAAFMFKGSAIGADALLQQARQALAAGRKEQAGKLIESLVKSPVPFPYRHEAVQLFERVTGKNWLQPAVGVVLPLSGRYAAFGDLVRRGMELALQVHDEGASSRISFIFRDSAADPTKAAEAVSELAEEQGVMAVAGPLTSAASLAAAQKAQQEQVPLLTFSQRQGLPQVGDYVFRDSLTPRQQVKSLVRYAMEERKMSTFAILYPQNEMGREMSELFTREVEKRGGRIVATQSYDEYATSFGRQIKELKGENPDEPEPSPGSADATKEKPPLGFDALFIPDYADRVGLIAPQLAFYGVEKVPLLGINGWNSPDLIRLAGQYVNGAVFVDGFFLHSPHSYVRDFVSLYTQKYGGNPNILEAQGFDVASIFLSLLDNPDVRTRKDLRTALSGLRKYPGVTGATSFDDEGNAQKPLFLLKVEDGKIVQIN